MNGDLLSETFFINMAKIVNDMLLNGAPALGVTELAQQFALPAEQVRACLESHGGSLINGEKFLQPRWATVIMLGWHAPALCRSPFQLWSQPPCVSDIHLLQEH